jgi:hypothetical protein
MKTIIIMLMAMVNYSAVKIKQSPFIELDRATTYYCQESQCDNDPLTTADGSVIDPVKLKNNEIRWCALSRDLIWDEYRQGIHAEGFRGVYEFGDTILVLSKTCPQISGKWVIHDTMNERYTNSIDFLIHPDNNNPKLGVCEDVKILKPNYTAYRSSN